MSFDNEYHLNSKTRTTFYRNFTNFIVIKVTSDSMPSIERWNFFNPRLRGCLVQRESLTLIKRMKLAPTPLASGVHSIGMIVIQAGQE